MTIVISVLTHEGVLQASDRRLVWIEPDGSFRLKDDNRNKAVLFGNRIVFAYTGLAQLGPRRQPTDNWLADTIHGNRDAGDQGAILDALAEAATERLNHRLYRTLPPAQRAHEFVACGWACLPMQQRGFSPYFAVVTNMRGSNGEVLAVPADHCEVLWESLKAEEDFKVMTAGQELNAKQDRELRSDVAHAGPDLANVGAVLIEHIRHAALSNDAIGRGVLLNSLPRGAIRAGDDGVRFLVAPPMAECATCFSVPSDPSDPRQYGPIAVSPSGGVFANFMAGPAASLGFPPG